MNILILAAHPDDECLGMGATIAKLTSAGHIVYCWFYFSGTNCNGIQQEQPKEVADVLGTVYPPFVMPMTVDNESDTIPLLGIVRSIEDAIAKVKPEVVYTHSTHDITRDHRNIFEATLVATRPFNNNNDNIQRLLTYENALTTNKTFGQFGSFTPNVYEEISINNLNNKISAISVYHNVINYPIDIITLCKLRGEQIGVDCAEAFELVWMRG